MDRRRDLIIKTAKHELCLWVPRIVSPSLISAFPAGRP